MVYKTGRERRAEWSVAGEFNCRYWHRVGFLPSPPDPNIRSRGGTQSLKLGITQNSTSVAFFEMILEPAVPSFDPFGDVFGSLPLPVTLVDQQFSIGVQTGGAPALAPDSDIGAAFWFALPSPTPAQFESECTVDYEVTFGVDLEEYFEVIEIPNPSDPNGFPAYGGVPNNPWNGFPAFDGSKHLRIRWFEATKQHGKINADATLTVTSTEGGGSARVSAESDIDVIIEWHEYGLTVETESLAADTFQTTHSGSQTFNGVLLRAPGMQISGSGYLNAWGEPFVMSVSGVPAEDNYQSVSITDATISPPYEHAYNLQLRNWTSAYPFGQKIRLRKGGTDVHPITDVLLATPNLSGEFEQYRAAGKLWRNGGLHLNYSLDTTGAVGWYLEDPFKQTEPSISANQKEAARDWRIMLSGTAWDAADWEMDNPHTIGAFSSADWSVTNASVASSTPYTDVEPVNPANPIVFTLDTIALADFRAYRFLRFPITYLPFSTPTTEPAVLTIDGRTFSASFDDTSTEIVFDLCNPDDLTPPLQTQDSIWDGLGDGTFGVGQAGEVTLSFKLAAKDFISFTGWQMFVSDSAALTCQSSFERWVEGSPERKRFLWLNTDHRIGYEREDMQRTGVAPFYSYSWRSISQLVGDQPKGITITEKTTFPADDFHKNARDAINLGGNGCIITGPIDALVYEETIGVDALTPRNLRGQMQWDSAIGYPIIGNCWDLEPYPDGTDPSIKRALGMRSRKYLRSTSWGLVIGSGGSMGSDVVDALDIVANEPYTDTTDAIGRYTMQHLRGGADHTISYTAASLSNAITVAPRHWHRTAFTGETRFIGAYAVSPSLQHVLGSFEPTPSGLRIGLSFAGNEPFPLAFQLFVTSTPAQNDGMGLAFSDAGTLYVVWRDAGDVKLGRADTYSAITTMATIAAGTDPQIDVSRTGWLYIYWRDGSEIKGQIRDPRGNIVQSVFSAVASGVTGGFSARWSPTAGGSWRMIIIYTSGGNVVQVTSPDGVVFS